jgi:TetR/AcrR family transcriptional regulator, acrAB operon repressor
MRRTKEEAAKTREALLKAALRVFSRSGFSGSTLEDVSREAGLTRGAIYWHFGSKTELYQALMNEYADISTELVQSAAAEGGSLVNILRRIFLRLLTAVETNPSLREVMEINLFKTERTLEFFEIQQKQRQNTNRLVEEIAQAMHQGIAAGELRFDLDASAMARAFLAFQNGIIYLWLSDPGVFSLQESAPAMVEIFLNGIIMQEKKR